VAGAAGAASTVTTTRTTTRNRRVRRRTVVAAALAIYLGVAALFVAALSVLLAPAGGGGSLFGARVAVVELDGAIVDVDELVRELRAHRDNPLVKAVVIRINSPGGVVAPTQELHAALTRVRESGKPVVASLGAVAASGGYYVAVAADKIYANPGTLTGSIGVIMRLANLDGLMKKVGVDFVVVKAGRFKDLGNVARSMTPEERRVLQVMLEDVHGQFINAVAAGRKLDRAQVLGFADGRIVSGAQAKALNMVDALGGLEEALDGAATLAGLSKPPRVIGPRRRLSIMDLLKNRLDLGTWLSLPPALSVFKTPLYLMD
jgi:protease-4